MDQKDKIQIKLERHKWPDELAREKKKRKQIFGVSITLLVVFFLGWQTGRLFLGNTSFLQQSSDVAKFERVYRDVLGNWFFKKDMKDPKTELIDNAIKGMLAQNGDIHTSYMTKEEVQSFNQSLSLNFVGIGVKYFSGNNLNVITDIFKNSPAEKAGIQVGDMIKKVDGVAVTPEASLQSMVLGEAGTPVVLDILRNQEMISLTLVRQEVSALASGHMMGNDTGYLSIASFGAQLGAITESYLSDFKANNAQNLIIDLRDNGGGLLDAVNQLSRLFLANGTVVYKESYTSGKEDTYTVKNSVSEKYPFKKIVILINENSASASEVLTLALSQNPNVKTVGRKSYGKGTVQVSYSYPDQTALKVTIAKWFGPDGKSIDKTGIEPAYPVDLADVFYTPYVDVAQGVSYAPDSVHDAVAFVQKSLKFLGFHDGRTDGYFDAKTEAALGAYSQKNNFGFGKNIDHNVTSQVYSSVLLDWHLSKDTKDVQLKKALEVAHEQ